MFFLYAAPALRMTALQQLRLIGIATHDSIGIGEDGPTHQPIGLASLFRSIPNILFFRPADAEEVMGAWQIALAREQQTKPSILSLSRQNVPLLPGSSRELMKKGAYVICEYKGDRSHSQPSLTLVATGAEVSRAVDAAKELVAHIDGADVRVVSMPCQRLFDEQSKEYKQATLPSRHGLIVAVEAWSSYGWARYAHASCSMHSFGLSGPQADLFEHFGFGVENIVKVVHAYYKRQCLSSDPIPGVGEFDELLL